MGLPPVGGGATLPPGGIPIVLAVTILCPKEATRTYPVPVHSVSHKYVYSKMISLALQIVFIFRLIWYSSIF